MANTLTSRHKKLFKWLLLGMAVAVSAYVGFIAYLFLSPAISDYAKRTEFNSSLWKKEGMEDDPNHPVRLRMVDNLLQTYTLVGMTKIQIDSLLGVPTPTQYFPDYSYVYWLGPERGLFGIDSEWLGIQFKNDTVVAAKVLQD